MITLDIIVDADDVTGTLNRMADFLSPAGMYTFFTFAVTPYLSKEARQRFASGGDSASGKWLPHAPATRNWRITQGFAPGPINVRTGELEDWVVNGGSSFLSAGGDSTLMFPGTMPIGVLREKVETAQRGKANPRTPARPVLALSETNAMWIMMSLMEGLEQAARLP